MIPLWKVPTRNFKFKGHLVQSQTLSCSELFCIVAKLLFKQLCIDDHYQVITVQSGWRSAIELRANRATENFVFADSKLHNLWWIMKIWFVTSVVLLIVAVSVVHANHEADPLCFNIFLFSNFTLAQCNSSFSQYLVRYITEYCMPLY